MEQASSHHRRKSSMYIPARSIYDHFRASNFTPSQQPHHLYPQQHHRIPSDSSAGSLHGPLFGSPNLEESSGSAITTPGRSPVPPHGTIPTLRLQTQDFHCQDLSFYPSSAEALNYCPTNANDYNYYEFIEEPVYSAQSNHQPTFTPLDPSSATYLDTSPLQDPVFGELANRHLFPVQPLYDPVSLTPESATLPVASLGSYIPAHHRSRSYEPPYPPAPAYSKPNSITISPETVKPAYSHSRSHSLPTSQPINEPQEPTLFPPIPEIPSTTLRAYMTSRNPSPTMLPIHAGSQRKRELPGETDFWWDVRNVRPWKSFNLDPVVSDSSISRLLSQPIAPAALSSPAIRNLELSKNGKESDLVDLIHSFYEPKLNALLAHTDNNLTMKTNPTPPQGKRRPVDFYSSPASDDAHTVYGDARGRVVGIVRPYNEWSSHKRRESPPRQIEYLRGLSNLHRHMREHGCRYGFIMTELELVCVRAKTDAESSKAIFGSLEVAEPIQIRTSYPPAALKSAEKAPASAPLTPPARPPKDRKMTALEGLWLLHMMAGEQPLPGHADWRLSVGKPKDLTRAHCEKDKDAWIPRVNKIEERAANRLRGWAFPNNPYNPKETSSREKRKSAARKSITVAKGAPVAIPRI